MFIYFGSYNKKIGWFFEPFEVCGNCGNIGIDVNVYRKFGHILFIPILPVLTIMPKIKR